MGEKRVFLIVLDSVGIGAMEDAAQYGDAGADTLASAIYAGAALPSLQKMGLFHIEGVADSAPMQSDAPLASYARLREKSKGKDTTIGHWEIAGVVSETPLPVFPNGFPNALIAQFEQAIGRKVLCNKPYSGTDVLLDYGKEQMDTGAVIVYTSADSVFQVAAHEAVVPIEELYAICDTARGLLTGEWGVGRVIARPFVGEYPAFSRTANRHDVSLTPPQTTMLDLILAQGKQVIGVGKIQDIFAGKGIGESLKTRGNTEGMQQVLMLAERDFHGLAFVNLVDFDMLYGHRNDATGYARALEEFDGWLPQFMQKMQEEDLLILTADHGCDPSHPGTDHTREFVPMLMYGQKIAAGVNLGTITGFDAIAATILDFLDIENPCIANTSFLRRSQK